MNNKTNESKIIKIVHIISVMDKYYTHFNNSGRGHIIIIYLA